jgi:signal transduction histidine kinase
VLLLVTLVVTVGLALEGRRSVRDHKEAVKKTLLDNAAFAAEVYRELTQGTITSYLRWQLPILEAPTQPRPDKVEFKQDTFPKDFAKRLGSDPTKNLRTQFAYDYTTDSLVLSKGSLSAADKAQLVAILRKHPLYYNFSKDWAVAFAADVVGPGGGVVGFVVNVNTAEATENSEPPRRIAIGLIADPRLRYDLLLGLTDLEKRMPRADTTVQHKRFALAVYAGGEVVRQEGDNSSRFAIDREWPAGLGGMTIRVAIDPDAVPAMAGAAVPPLRYAVIIGLALLISILILAALILGRRQSELAAAREDFVSNVSHELRTPLAQIRMFAETLLLGRTRNEVERRRALEVIDQEARRLTALVENVLNLRRGSARLAPAATELAPSVREILDAFSQMPRSRSVGFRLELEDRLVATVDPGAFRQILLNLLDNAIKYGPVGQRVSIGLAMFDTQARLWVDDEGPGIPERERERVFEPFYRVSNPADTSVAGSGIGLAVVRELAGLLGGHAWVADAPGGGARVVVEFPDAYLRAEEAAAGSRAVAVA